MKFIKVFFLSSTILFTILYGMVICIDPYNKLGINVFGFETKAVDFPRVNKFNQLEHSKKDYQAFLIGSSAAHRYPTAEIMRLSGLPAYNYAVQSSTPEDYLAMFNHIRTRFKPKLIILSFDFYALNKFVKTEDMFFASPLRDYLKSAGKKVEVESPGIFNKTYLTLEALRDSFKVVWVNMLGEARHAYLENGDYFIEPVSHEPIKIHQFPYPPYEFDRDRIQYSEEIKKQADLLGIRLIVFTSPISHSHWRRIQNSPELTGKLQEFKRTLIKIFGKIYDFNNDEMKNYDDPKYFIDSTHPTIYMSTLVLERVLDVSEKPQRFGEILR